MKKKQYVFFKKSKRGFYANVIDEKTRKELYSHYPVYKKEDLDQECLITTDKKFKGVIEI